MALATSVVALNPSTWTSLGTTAVGGGILISASGPVQIVAAASQPVGGPNVTGHPLPLTSLWLATPAATQFWGQSLAGAVNAVVTL
jgi:hypothetical protein